MSLTGVADPSIHVAPGKGYNSLHNSLGLEFYNLDDLVTFDVPFTYEDTEDTGVHPPGTFDYTAFVAFPEECNEEGVLCPAVIVAHAIGGLTDNEKMYTMELLRRRRY